MFLRKIKEDINTVFSRDPAAKNKLEIIFCYPGLHALFLYRIAHWFYCKKEYVTARLISHFARFITGIEIHPGAKIGRRFFIDHGMGVVIGETAEIGNDCLIYQGVVLGGTSLKKEKRHPTLEDEVVVGAGAIILGPITIGAGAKIGAGSVVVNNVAPGVTIVGVPGRIAEKREKVVLDLEHGKLPDPIAEAIRIILKEQDELEKRVATLESLEKVKTTIDEYVEKKKKELEQLFQQEEGD